jgi:broad specificity phosphatase PhoE
MVLKLAPGITLYFFRHGETEANVEKRYQGVATDTPLTARGRRQAKKIAKILKHHAGDLEDMKFVSSPLKRARTTMQIVRKHLHLPVMAYSIDPRLREINLGKWEGLTHKQARALDPAAFKKRERDKWHVPFPGGENYADVAVRAERWIASLKRDTVAVTHGGFTRILRGLFGGLTWQAISDLDEPQGVVFRVRGSKVKEFGLK